MSPRVSRAIVWWLLLAGSATAAEPSPAELARAFFDCKNRAIAGGTCKPAEEESIVDQLERVAGKATAETWRLRSNRDSISAFLLMGGDLRAVRSIVASIGGGEDERIVRDAAVAAAEFRGAEAASLLAKVDARRWAGLAAGLIALSQARFTQRDDRARAVHCLDLARLLAPGTLIEETALRREIQIFSATHDIAKVATLWRRYRSVFAKSGFADRTAKDFRQFFRSAWASRGASDRELLAKAAERWGDEERASLLVMTSRASLLSGALEGARLAASMAENAPGGDKARLRAAAIDRAVAGLFGDGRAGSIDRLESLKTGDLPDVDMALIEAGLTLARRIDRVDVGATDRKPEATAAIDGARAALKAASDALSKGR